MTISTRNVWRAMDRLVQIFLIAFAFFGDSACMESPSENLLEKPDGWFRQEDGREAVKNILSWQMRQGDWAKNEDASIRSYSGDADKLIGTFDNGATCGELRVLAKAYRESGEDIYTHAFLAGFDSYGKTANLGTKKPSVTLGFLFTMT